MAADKFNAQLPSPMSESCHPVLEQISPATSFTLFPNLTPELRIQIWRSYLLNPRLITISAHPSSSSSTNPSNSANANQTFHIARYASSALLSVNSEARYEAITHYSRLPSRDEVRKDRLPYHAQHKSSTKGFYRSPGEDVVYLKGCYYDSRWFRGVGVVGREVVSEPSSLLSLCVDPNSTIAAENRTVDRTVGGRGSVPLVGRIKTLALDEAFLSDETLFRRPEVSPVMVYLMRDLKGLERLIVVRVEGEETDEGEIGVRIEDARERLVWQCELWGYGEEVEELRAWKCPVLSVMGREELGEFVVNGRIMNNG